MELDDDKQIRTIFTAKLHYYSKAWTNNYHMNAFDLCNNYGNVRYLLRTTQVSHLVRRCAIWMVAARLLILVWLTQQNTLTLAESEY